MPTYEYLCTECNHQWEELQKITEAPIEACPNCSKSTAKRQISGGSFILKGGGWYADLYSSPGKKSSNGDSKSGDASSASTKSESKSESASSGGDTSSSSSSPKTETKTASSAPAGGGSGASGGTTGSGSK